MPEETAVEKLTETGTCRFRYVNEDNAYSKPNCGSAPYEQRPLNWSSDKTIIPKRSEHGSAATDYR